MKRGAGFTLIEVMLVLVILLVLAGLAYPNYARAIKKTRRIEAQVAMIEAIQLQDLYYSQHNTYVAFSSASQDAPAPGFKWWSGATAASSAYELEAAACPDKALTECVEVRATPGTAQVDTRFADPDCGTLTMNTAGEQAASGSYDRCWP
jgi:type IV pilus assembly protein PilE